MWARRARPRQARRSTVMLSIVSGLLADILVHSLVSAPLVEPKNFS